MWKYVVAFARQNNHSFKETFCYTSSENVIFRVFGVNFKRKKSATLSIMYVYNL